MSAALQLNRTWITLKDDEFSNGFQVGYLRFKTDFQGKPMSDELLYTIIAQTFVDVRRTDRYKAGYLTGFFTAILETPSERRFPVISVQASFPQAEASR